MRIFLILLWKIMNHIGANYQKSLKWLDDHDRNEFLIFN
jgi:hypothetical protein